MKQKLHRGKLPPIPSPLPLMWYNLIPLYPLPTALPTYLSTTEIKQSMIS